MGIPISTKKHDAGKIPGPANVPSVIEIKCIGSLPNGKPTSWAVHGHYATNPGNLQTMANTLWTSISGAWGTNIAPLCPPATTFNAVQVRDMTSFTNPIFVGTGTAIPGTAAGIAMPVDNSIVLTENISARGRGSKGRIYLGGFAVGADATGGQITTAAQTAINAFGTALFNAINAVTLTPCVAQVARAQYQGFTGTIHAARQASFVPITTYTCRDLLWDTQRRRGQL